MALRVTAKEEQRILHLARPLVFALKITVLLRTIQDYVHPDDQTQPTFSNIFVTHSQTECVKLIDTISGTVIFFKQLAKLYRAFSIHLKHRKATRLPVTEAMKEFSDLKRFLEGTFSIVKESLKTAPRKLPMAPRDNVKSDPKVRADDL